MPSFNSAIRPFVDVELTQSWHALRRGAHAASFRQLERAHVLGQSSTDQYVRVHVHMLVWGVRARNFSEVAVQLLRIAGAATKTPFGMVRSSNTGGSNVSPVRRMAVPPDLAQIIAAARQGDRSL